jgi:hypothetical protein
MLEAFFPHSTVIAMFFPGSLFLKCVGSAPILYSWQREPQAGLHPLFSCVTARSATTHPPNYFYAECRNASECNNTRI